MGKYKVGDDLPAVKIGELTKPMIAEYSRVSKDPNPMHTDDEIAKMAGYPGVFAQGMLGMGFLSRYLVSLCGVGKLKRIKVRFKTLSWPGEVITCRAKVAEVNGRDVTCDVHTENQDGEPKVIGSATFEVSA